MFLTLMSMAFAAEVDQQLAHEVAAEPEKAAGVIQQQQAKIKMLQAQLAAAKVAPEATKAGPTSEVSALQEQIAQEEAKLAAEGVADKMDAAVATELMGDAAPAKEQAPQQPVVPQNPCMGHAWIVGTLNDPNGYGLGGAFKCYSDTNAKSIKFDNKSKDYGYVVVLNGFVVVPQTAGAPTLLPTSGVPRELKAQIDAAGIGWLPMLPPGEILYGSSPSLSGTWRLYRFLRDPVTGTYELDEAFGTRPFDQHGSRVAWHENLGEGFGYGG